MIEKLKPLTEIDSENNPIRTLMPDSGTLMGKINELVDAVNNLQTSNTHIQKDLCEMRHPEAKVDPYAEQRKWIGKLCWFWDDEYYLKTAGVLEEITTIEGKVYYAKKDIRTVWEHCEPVKPDDDIIYKGGDNE